MNSESTAPAKPRPQDVESPDAIVKAMYDCISGPAGSRNWYRLRSLYLEGAQIIPTGKRVHKDGELQVMSVDQWIDDVSPYFADNDFYEQEVVRLTHRFGDMIQAFSTYEARHDPEKEPIARGINSLQLLQHQGRWWIVSMMWDNESKENPIPGEFLPHLW